jgi:EAL and modified HD-GYP domain-containing signal transduction protein
MDSGTLLARQAIYDRDLAIHAWELLFRAHGSDADTAEFGDGDSATSSVLLNAFGSLPLVDILEGKPAYVNFTRKLLDFTPPIDTSQLVVEILEDVPIDASTIEAITRLKSQGYTIALDDYVYVEGHHELVQLADVIKIDVLAQPAHSLPELVAQFAPYGKRLLAEKVETMATYQFCRELGFELFQGYFLSRPELVRGRVLKNDQRSVLQLLALMRTPEVEFRDVERIIQADSVLAYKVLRMVNSAYFNLPRKIDTIRQALTLLGMDRIRSWAQLLALSNLDQKPAGLYLSAMVRARMGELMAAASPSPSVVPETQFTVGLLSTLDAFMGSDLATILDTVALSADIKSAILERAGDAGLLLDTAEHYEHAAFDAIDWPLLQQRLGLDPSKVRKAYLTSLSWADETLKFLR